METGTHTDDRTAVAPGRTRECRDVEAAVRDLDGVSAADVRRAAGETATEPAVPEEYDRTVFELGGLDCRTCASLVEVALMRLADVSNACASHRTSSVRVDFDPETTTVAALRAELRTLGYPVETTDEAFANRRTEQWADARFAAGIMAGLMVFAPYAGVIYPTRWDLPFYDPRVVELLESALTSVFATHFYLNIAMLTGVVLLFTGKPILDDAETAVRELSPNHSLAIATLAIGLYCYSSFTAFWLTVDGGVYYDVVVALIVGATIARQSSVEASEPAVDPDTVDAEAVDSTESGAAGGVEVATDGGYD